MAVNVDNAEPNKMMDSKEYALHSSDREPATFEPDAKRAFASFKIPFDYVYFLVEYPFFDVFLIFVWFEIHFSTFPMQLHEFQT